MAKRDKYIGAVLSLKDQFTGKLKGIRKENAAFRNDIKSTGAELKKTFDKPYKAKVDTKEAISHTQKLKNELKVLGNMVVTATVRVKDQATSQLARIRDRALSVQNVAIGATAGAVGAVGGVYAAQGAFDKTIGESARMELSQTQIKAMFRNDKVANDYMSMMEKMAIASPVLS